MGAQNSSPVPLQGFPSPPSEVLKSAAPRRPLMVRHSSPGPYWRWLCLMSQGKEGSTTQEVYRELTAIFQDILDDPTIMLRPELTASDVYGWDSLSHVRLVLAVEKNFRINFSAFEVARLKNVGEFVDLIMAKARLSST